MKKSLLTPDLFIEKICNGTYYALKSLIDSCYYSQVAYRGTACKVNDMAWWKEYCTIRMACSRRSGHTSAIAKVIPEYFDKALILCVNQDIAERVCGTFVQAYASQNGGRQRTNLNGEPLLKQTRYKLITENSEYDFGTINSLDNYRGSEFQAIIVDVACVLNNKKTDEIYEKLGASMQKYPEKFFIFVE
jgi:hypothetical protein